MKFLGIMQCFHSKMCRTLCSVFDLCISDMTAQLPGNNMSIAMQLTQPYPHIPVPNFVAISKLCCLVCDASTPQSNWRLQEKLPFWPERYVIGHNLVRYHGGARRYLRTCVFYSGGRNDRAYFAMIGYYRSGNCSGCYRWRAQPSSKVTGLNSEWSLVRLVNSPKGHWSEWSIVQRVISPNGHWSNNGTIEIDMISWISMISSVIGVRVIMRIF